MKIYAENALKMEKNVLLLIFGEGQKTDLLEQFYFTTETTSKANTS